MKSPHLTTGLLGLLLFSAFQPVRAEEPLPVDAAALERWQDMRFGLFIHWGPVSLRGTEIGWSRGSQVPQAEYDNLKSEFNPVLFDADAWALTAKNAGMKYMVITTKHHDGFCLWPSKFTEHDMDNTPFKRDILKELSEACRRHGIAFGTYYSACDWYHPDFPRGSPGGRSNKPKADLANYDRYLQGQVRELVENYGPLLTIWFDVPQAYHEGFGIPMVNMLRKLQPDVVYNNRAYSARSGGTVGDYSTPEQRIGGFDRDRPWETCMTICHQWAWKPNDKMKSLEQCLHTLIKTAAGDGNLLFNVGPMLDGRIEARQVQRLKEMGDWLARYGESIYGTRGGPWKPKGDVAATCKGNTIYLHLLNGKAQVTLPALEARILKAQLLGGDELAVDVSEEGWTVKIPEDSVLEIDTVLRLELDRNAEEIAPLSSARVMYQAQASNVYMKQVDQYGAEMALDGDTSTRWATDAGLKECWIEISFSKEKLLKGLAVDEWEARIQSYELQSLEEGKWVTFHKGTTLGQGASVGFPPRKIKALRLHILDASDGPSINEIAPVE